MNKLEYDVAIIGGGAAGFFAAINAAENAPEKKIVILEKTSKTLAKVKISGGGRCNVTHACYKNHNLIKAYPRGAKFLKSALKQFSVNDTIDWFQKRGVKLKTEEDGRMFPVTDNSQTIINCLLNEITKFKIELITSVSIQNIQKIKENGFVLFDLNNERIFCKSLIVAAGGSPKIESYSLISNLGHTIIPPVPSLFTFNIPDSDLKDLSGISVPEAEIRIAGKKLENQGPLLITHWGLSGPAVLKTSAWGARELHEVSYNFNVNINWIAENTEMKMRETLNQLKAVNSRQKISAHSYFGLPNRLWQRLLTRSSIDQELRWVDISNKQLNLLMENLIRANYKVSGKTTFKEEFVTCGGVDLQQVNADTMESNLVPRLFFAGEVLDVDGITGGYNFQNAWTTGFIAGKNAAL